MSGRVSVRRTIQMIDPIGIAAHGDTRTEISSAPQSHTPARLQKLTYIAILISVRNFTCQFVWQIPEQ